MSLILEALKKSESERRLGRIPDLLTPMPGGSLRRHRASTRRVVPVLLILLMGSGILAAGWWWQAQRNAASPAIVATPTVPQERAPHMATNAAPTPLEPIPPQTASPTPRRPANALSASQGSEPVRENTGRPSQERETPSAVAPVEPLPRPEAQPTPIPPAPTATVNPLAPGGTSATPGSKAASVPELESASPEPLPRLHELPPSERDALPPLKLSMHVYTEAPQTRFVLIDGRRYREGEKLTSTLRVAEVRRDGIVLDSGKRRFLLPRP